MSDFSIIGKPTAMVDAARKTTVAVKYTDDLSEPAILSAVRAGRLYLSAGPQLTLAASSGGQYAMLGDVLSVARANPLQLTARWDGCPPNAMLTLVVDGEARVTQGVDTKGTHAWTLDAAHWCLLTLRGPPTIYYADEIGMHDVPVPVDARHDPLERIFPGQDRVRDPERTPMQWIGSPNAGFCPPHIESWLPIAADYQERNVAQQLPDDRSLLALTRALYAERKGWPLEGIEVRLSQEKIHARDCVDCETKDDTQIHRINREIAVTGPLTAEQRQRLLEIADRCPVHRTLMGQKEIVTRLAGGA